MKNMIKKAVCAIYVLLGGILILGTAFVPGIILIGLGLLVLKYE